jgi:hypothetical protein
MLVQFIRFLWCKIAWISLLVALHACLPTNVVLKHGCVATEQVRVY